MRVTYLRYLLIVMLSGCTVGPDYQSVQLNAPEHWQAESELSREFKQVDARQLDYWWHGFSDDALNHLMLLALKGNKDLKMAQVRIIEARAERGGVRAGLFPSVNVKAGAQRQDNPMPAFAPGMRYNLFELGFDALWEVDVFGRQQRRLEAATADVDAANESYRQAAVLLTAEVARCYIEYRNGQQLLRITQANLATMQKTQTLTERRFQEGVGTRYDVVRAKAQTETTQAQLPVLQANKIANLRQLELLIGGKPGSLAAELDKLSDIPTLSGQMLLMSPVETLRHRPDIHVAERHLAAATAMQGAAMAELFPKISLSAFLGLRNTDLDSLFKSAAFSYGTLANLVQPLLNFGKIQAGIDLADAKQKEAYLAYEKTVLDALRETETALTRYLQEEIRRQRLVGAVAEQQESLRLSQLRYKEGASSFLDVLEAQRALYVVESELANSQAASAIYLVALYKSLGGGANAVSLALRFNEETA